MIFIITFYTTHCPKCRILQKKLENKNIQYVLNENIDEMVNKGIKSAPYLEIDSELLDFRQACDWINNQEDNG